MNIEKTITRQIAECMAFSGDNPEEFLTKLESLVLEWYTKGRTGIKIQCPHCRGFSHVKELYWDIYKCSCCGLRIPSEECILEGS